MRQANNAKPGSEDDRRARVRKRAESAPRARPDGRSRKGEGLDEALEEFAERAEDLVGISSAIESELFKALEDAGQSARRQRARCDRSAQRAEICGEDKQQMANELTSSNRTCATKFRITVRTRRERPRRAGEIVNELEGSGVLQSGQPQRRRDLYGRAREAAPREGYRRRSRERSRRTA